MNMNFQTEGQMILKQEHLGLPLAPEKPSEYCYKAGELLPSRRDLNWSHNIMLTQRRFWFTSYSYITEFDCSPELTFISTWRSCLDGKLQLVWVILGNLWQRGHCAHVDGLCSTCTVTPACCILRSWLVHVQQACCIQIHHSCQACCTPAVHMPLFLLALPEQVCGTLCSENFSVRNDQHLLSPQSWIWVFSCSVSQENRADLPSSSSYFRSLTKCCKNTDKWQWFAFWAKDYMDGTETNQYFP